MRLFNTALEAEAVLATFEAKPWEGKSAKLHQAIIIVALDNAAFDCLDFKVKVKLRGYQAALLDEDFMRIPAAMHKTLMADDLRLNIRIREIIKVKLGGRGRPLLQADQAHV